MIERMEWDTAEIPLTVEELNAMLTREYAPTEAEPLPFCKDDAAAVRLMAACNARYSLVELRASDDFVSNDWIFSIDCKADTSGFEGQHETLPLAVAKAAYFAMTYTVTTTSAVLSEDAPDEEFVEF